MHLVLVSGRDRRRRRCSRPRPSRVSGVTTNGGAFGGSLSAAAGELERLRRRPAVTIAGETGGVWRVLAVSSTTLVLGEGQALADGTRHARHHADDACAPHDHGRRRSGHIHGRVTIVANADNDGGTVTRASGSWTADGFEIGQWVMIDGIAGIGWRLLGITNGGLTLVLGRGSPLAELEPDHEDGLRARAARRADRRPRRRQHAALHELRHEREPGTRVTRFDGLAWADDGYATTFANGLPQHVQVGAEASTRTISSFGNAACPFSDPFPGCGVGSVMVSSAARRWRR